MLDDDDSCRGDNNLLLLVSVVVVGGADDDLHLLPQATALVKASANRSGNSWASNETKMNRCELLMVTLCWTVNVS